MRLLDRLSLVLFVLRCQAEKEADHTFYTHVIIEHVDENRDGNRLM